MPPPLYLGCAALGCLDRDSDDPELMVTAVLESPAYVGFDVASHHGDAETTLGDILHLPHVQTRFPRASYQLLARGGRVRDDGSRVSWKLEDIRDSLQETLTNLQTQYVDTYFLFDLEYAVSDQWKAELPQTLEYLAEQRRSGIVRRIGYACQPLETLPKLFRLLPQSRHMVDVVFCYGHTTMLHAMDANIRTELPDYRKNTSSALSVLRDSKHAIPDHIQLLDGSPLALGQLRGRMQPIHPLAQASPFVQQAGSRWPKVVHEWNKRLYERDGRKLAELAIDYTLSRTIATGVIVGASAMAEIAMAIRAWKGVELREWEVLEEM
jgi:aryl-alcohol dehydrogenase-like predicted oxidoreductase